MLLNYVSEIPEDRLRGYEEIEANRQALQRGEATQGALAYARFLSAIENDATYSFGAFKPARPDDADVIRRWPFLAELVEARRC